MHTRRLIMLTAFVVTTAFGTLFQQSHAEIRPPQQPKQHGSAFLTKKVILSDRSIDGPGFFSTTTPDFEGNLSAQTVLAWTGTDALHRLNVMTSHTQSPAILVFEDKLTLAETSFARPAVIQTPIQEGGIVGLAWTGTDAHHSLNILWNVYNAPGSPQKS